MARIFKTPFGAQGDTEQVPEAPQGDGSVSLTQGFGYDYEREYEDPAAKDIRREVMNGLFHDITEAIGDIQLSGVAKWSEEAAPYPAGAVVWHDSVAWVSTAGNNSSEPGTGADWSAVDLSSSIRLSEPIDQVPSANNVQEALTGLGAFAADGYQNIAVFDTAGVTNWTVPDVLRQGLRKAHVTVIGGGGGGARGLPGGESSGGGGGGVALGIYDLSGLTSIAVTVGAGGAGGSGTSGGAGGAGGSSSFEGFCSATGGGGGQFQNASTGASGSGAGGDINYGLGGGGASTPQITGSTPRGGAGGGGSSPSATSSGPPTKPGDGGGGRYLTNGMSGADGIVIVRW